MICFLENGTIINLLYIKKEKTMKKLIMIFAIILISNIQINATEISNYGPESNLKGVESGWQWIGERSMGKME